MSREFSWDRFAFGFGPRGFFWAGPRGRRRRWFESGDMKYVILKLLKDKPRHGYEVMKELQEQLHGCYSHRRAPSTPRCSGWKTRASWWRRMSRARRYTRSRTRDGGFSRSIATWWMTFSIACATPWTARWAAGWRTSTARWDVC